MKVALLFALAASSLATAVSVYLTSIIQSLAFTRLHDKTSTAELRVSVDEKSIKFPLSFEVARG